MRALVVTGTRADFGLWRPVLDAFGARDGDMTVHLLVTAMHLDSRFGNTVAEVRAAGFPIAAEVPCTPEGDDPVDMAAGLGMAIEALSPAIADARPDWLLVLGDRGEQLAAALAALHLGTAVGHVHGGERTRGAVDDVFRDLITRIAHLHLVASDGARERLLARGEEAWRIHVTGAPGLDAIAHMPMPAEAELRARYNLPPAGPYLLVLVHPETGHGADPPDRLAAAILDGLEAHRLPIVAIWPNADAGGRAIAERLERQKDRFAAIRTSVPHADYLGLLRGAAALVGNSSSGIIEAPMLGVPAVNIGRRQEGRERGDNVLEVAADASAVAAAIDTALAPEFRARLSRRSPYGDGRAAERIAQAVLATPIDERLMRKQTP